MNRIGKQKLEGKQNENEKKKTLHTFRLTTNATPWAWEVLCVIIVGHVHFVRWVDESMNVFACERMHKTSKQTAHFSDENRLTWLDLNDICDINRRISNLSAIAAFGYHYNYGYNKSITHPRQFNAIVRPIKMPIFRKSDCMLLFFFFNLMLLSLLRLLLLFQWIQNHDWPTVWVILD